MDAPEHCAWEPDQCSLKEGNQCDGHSSSVGDIVPDPERLKSLAEALADCGPLTADSWGVEEGMRRTGIELRKNRRGEVLEYRTVKEPPTGDDGKHCWEPSPRWSTLDDEVSSAWLEWARDNLRVRTWRTVVVKDDDGQTVLDEDGDPLTERRPGSRAWRMSKGEYHEALLALSARRRVDPLIEYLEALAPWDEVPRLDTALIEVFKAEDDPLARWAGGAPLKQAVARAYAKDEMPRIRGMVVLLGGEWTGKSAWWANLVPHPRLMTDSLAFELSKQERIEALQGVVFAEVSEMSGTDRSSTPSIKSFITATRDKYRPPYYRAAIDVHRLAVIVGTANDSGEGVLPDDADNTRFVCIECGTPDAPVEPWLEERRDQLWAEALHAYQTEGDNGGLPRELRALQRSKNAVYRRTNSSLDQKIAKLIAEGGLADGMHVSEVAKAISVWDGHGEMDRGLQTRVGRALQAVGCDKKRMMRDRVQQTLWFADGQADSIPDDEERF